jgi:hypothetical protein
MDLKTIYGETVKSQLKVWDVVIEDLERVPTWSLPRNKAKRERTVAQLRAREECVRQLLREMMDPANELWTDVKVELDKATDEIKDALGRALSDYD